MSTRAGKRFAALMVGVVTLGFAVLAPWATAEEAVATTGLKVLVRADDAKFIGSGVGGLNIIVRDAATGELLAEGAITGPTGDTEALMQTPQVRGRVATLGDPASFQAELGLARPTRVEVSVTGPLAVAQSIQSTSATLWLIPGQDRIEQPVILHLPGLVTELLKYTLEDGQLALTASVTMICGCPITAEGLWPAADFRAAVQLYRQGELVAEAPLGFTGTDNEFAGKLDLPGAGAVDMVVHAYQISTGNAGVYERSLRIE
ncbi:hypothetical protein Q6D67_05090 [Haliea sp. E1-2-M8]|uniref:hypothetical protein n=1 Tax=Haliea sp. E1-2-M8 TaxID=3064706 RepID=UPI002724C588|nr:hypothetical protein [Haliea sp. E1-2-M8]MDO8861072.1 hypothetical protein [Haliea sp. E1-2-M8]